MGARGGATSPTANGRDRGSADRAERTFECTLDPASFEAFARILANHFVERPGFPTREELRAGASRMDAFANTPEHLLRENLSLWAGQVEPSAGRFWSGHGRR